MPNRTVDYRDGDTQLEGYLALPDGATGRLPLVIIAHAWAGRDRFECEVADRLAGQGYAAFAMDNFGKGVLGRDNEENQKLMMPFIEDRGMLRQRLMSGLDAARSLPEVDISRIAAIGFCFGGLCVLDMARAGAELRGVVSIHGLFTPPEGLEQGPIRSSVLALHGHEDPMVPPKQVQAFEAEMTEAGVDWQLQIFGHTSHAFTHPEANQPENGLQYQARSATRAWHTLDYFLSEVLETSG